MSAKQSALKESNHSTPRSVPAYGFDNAGLETAKTGTGSVADEGRVVPVPAFAGTADQRTKFKLRLMAEPPPAMKFSPGSFLSPDPPFLFGFVFSANGSNALCLACLRYGTFRASTPGSRQTRPGLSPNLRLSRLTLDFSAPV
jgi:hypothetical protein